MMKIEFIKKYGGNEWIHPKTGESRYYLDIAKVTGGKNLTHKVKGVKVFVVNNEIIFSNLNDMPIITDFLTEANESGIVCEEAKDFYSYCNIYA